MAKTHLSSLDVEDHDGSAAGLYLAGTLVTATAAELNTMADGVTATAAEINAVADMSTHVTTITTATAALTAAAHGNRIVNLDRAAGIGLTLPAAAGTGYTYTVIIKTTISSNTTTISAANASDSFVGLAVGVDDDAEGATGYTWNAETNDDRVTMDGSAQGGKEGDMWIFTDYVANKWHVRGFITQSGGSEATPFSAAVS